MKTEKIEFKGSCQSCSVENWLQLVRIEMVPKIWAVV